jgi:O-antigen/teichoic acid export membrane protein
MSIDTVAARHWLSGSASGLYAAASIAGSIAYFMPAAISTAVFPDVAKGVENRDKRSFLLGLAEVAALALGTAAALSVASSFPIGYDAARSALQILSISYALLGILGYLVSHHLAHASKAIFLPWVGTGLLTVLVFTAHGSLTSVAVDALCSTGALVVIMGVASACIERSTGHIGTHRQTRIDPSMK